MACALVASRLVSMTFIPLLGYYLLRRAASGRSAASRSGAVARLHRRLLPGRQRRDPPPQAGASLGSLAVLVLGGWSSSPSQGLLLPRRRAVTVLRRRVAAQRRRRSMETDRAAAGGRGHVRIVATQYGKDHAARTASQDVLQSITTFVGGGAPRFWFSVTPEPQRAVNYAQVLVRVTDKDATPGPVGPLQRCGSSAAVPGAIVDVHQLQTNPVPLSGRGPALRPRHRRGRPRRRRTSTRCASCRQQVQAIIRKSPLVARVRDDWGERDVPHDARRRSGPRQSRRHHQPGHGGCRRRPASPAPRWRRCATATARSRSIARHAGAAARGPVGPEQPLRLLHRGQQQGAAARRSPPSTTACTPSAIGGSSSSDRLGLRLSGAGGAGVRGDGQGAGAAAAFAKTHAARLHARVAGEYAKTKRASASSAC